MTDTVSIPSMGSVTTSGLNMMNGYIQNNKWKATTVVYYGKGLVRWKWLVPLMIVMIIILVSLTATYSTYTAVTLIGSGLSIILTAGVVAILAGKFVPFMWPFTKPLEGIMSIVMELENQTGLDTIGLIEQISNGVSTFPQRQDL